MKKRVLRLLTAVVIMTVLCVGCGKKNSDEGVSIRIGSLKGPTSIGLVYMMEQMEKGNMY